MEKQEYTAKYMHDGKYFFYSFTSTSDNDAIRFANWKLGRAQMAVVRHEGESDIEIYNSLNLVRL